MWKYVGHSIMDINSDYMTPRNNCQRNLVVYVDRAYDGVQEVDLSEIHRINQYTTERTCIGFPDRNVCDSRQCRRNFDKQVIMTPKKQATHSPMYSQSIGKASAGPTDVISLVRSKNYKTTKSIRSYVGHSKVDILAKICSQRQFIGPKVSLGVQKY